MRFVFGLLPVIALFVAALAIATIFIITFLRSPFRYPYFFVIIDISGRKKPKVEDLVDEYLNDGHFSEIANHNQEIEFWKNRSLQRLETYHYLKNYRQKQYQKSIDDEHAFVFRFTRRQTRYRQQSYVRFSYEGTVIDRERAFSFLYLKNREYELSKIDHKCTLSAYNNANQRKLMNESLRRRILERDGYTCQKCRLYRPDGNGLEIDHIVPISKGGKTIDTNLQVLCVKCNRKKSNKIDYTAQARDRTTIYI